MPLRIVSRRLELESEALSHIQGRYGEFALVTALTLVALFLRAYRLEDFPPGFHGDEGLMGLDAQRILREGWIGPYLPSALGIPSGPVYWAAAVIKALGPSVFAARFALALLGTATIPIAYAAVRVMHGRKVALLAALFLTFSAWHLHFSRLAYITVAWPLMQMATVLFLFLAVRTRQWPYFALTGLMAGLGVFSYTAYPIFLVALAAFLAWLGLRGYFPRHLRSYALHVVLVGAGFVCGAFSMIQYAADESNGYFNHFRTYSLRESDRWQEASGLGGKAEILGGQARDWFVTMTWRGHFDAVDATGVRPMLDELTLALAAAGLVIAVANWRRLPHAFSLIMLLVIPIAAVITVEGQVRRTLGLAPIVAILMALPLAAIWQWAEGQEALRRRAAYAGIAGVVALVAILNLRFYFGTLATSDGARWVFVEELAEASRYIEDVNPDIVYFYAPRWSYNYETRKFLAPDVPGEDRSEQFGQGNTGLEADRSKDVLYIFIGPYVEKLPEVEAMYPAGQAYNGLADDSRLLFVAYRLPPHPALASQ